MTLDPGTINSRFRLEESARYTTLDDWFVAQHKLLRDHLKDLRDDFESEVQKVLAARGPL